MFSDYRLKPRNYSVLEGDQLVAECYSRNIPAVLCTAYQNADFMLDRSLGRRIPVLLRNTNPNPDDVEAAFKMCIAELQGQVASSRRPWRTLVRVNDVDPDRGDFYVVIPGWMSVLRSAWIWTALGKISNVWLSLVRDFTPR